MEGLGSLLKSTKVNLEKENITRVVWWSVFGFFGGIERAPKNIFVVPVPNRETVTLIPLRQKFMKPGTMVYSDCWKAYNGLGELVYDHHTVNHRRNFMNFVNLTTQKGCGRTLKGWSLE